MTKILSFKLLKEGMPGIFACYRFPSAAKSGNVQDLGELRWYFLPDGATEVLTTVDQINAVIACSKDTPRCPARTLNYRRERLKAIEAHIRLRDLKACKAVTMAQVAGGIGVESKLQLVTWMDVADPSDAGDSLSASLRNLK